MNLPETNTSEAAYLAALIQNQIAPGHLFLDPHEFTATSHQIIYERAAARLLGDIPLDPILLCADLRQNNELEIAGGEAVIQSLGALKAKNSDEHAQQIRRASVARQLTDLTVQIGHYAAADPARALESLLSKTDELRGKLTTSRRVTLTDAATLRARFGEQKWLWPGYIPIGHVTCLLAQQGQGKSNVALDFCHRLTIGADFPDGQAPGVEWDENERILYLDAEGFLQGILTRLGDWGTPDEPFIWPSGCDDKQWALNTSNGWAEFESIVAQFRPRLVIVDSLSAANTLEEKDNDQMKMLMQKFVHLAKHFRLALILIHHLRKAGVGEMSWPINLDRARGASMITQLCRVVLAVGTPDLMQPERRRLDTIKNNLAPFADAQGFEIFTEGLGWGEAPEPPRATKPRDAARAWLIDHLSGVEKRLAADVTDYAAQAGFAARTLYRAKEDLGIKISKEVGQNGRTFWALPSQYQPVAA